MHKKPDDFDTHRLSLFDQGWQTRTLPSGLTIMHAPLEGNDSFYIGATIRTGTRLEQSHETGVSHFLEHMMFRGSRKYPEFTALAEAFEWLGGDWNAATGHEHTEYWYAGIRHSAREAIDLFAEFLSYPMLKDIEVERQVILRELDGETNDLGHSTDLDYHIANLLWPHSTLAKPILGTRESLARMDVDLLKAYRKRHYTPQNTVICVVGGEKDLLDEVTEKFSSFALDQSSTPKTSFPELPIFHGPAVKWVEHNDNEFDIKVASLTCGEWHQDAPMVAVIARILSDGFSSRLARRLREELGLVYDIHAAANLGIDVGTLDIHGSCAVDQLDDYLRELFLLLRDLRDNGPTQDELERAKVRAIVDLELSLSHPEALGGRAAWASLCGEVFSLVRERRRVLDISMEKVRSKLHELFQPKSMAIAALGPKDKDIEGRLKRALVQGLSSRSS
jgi:predicted Zn-dependent peptidase